MRLARTTTVYFLSDVATSLIGFLATVYFARELGSAVLGQYFLVLALIVWLSVPINGIASAMTKRISEEVEQGELLTAGFLVNLAIASGIAGVAFLLRSELNDYVGATVGLLFIALFVVKVVFRSVQSGLRGQHKVAQSGLLTTFDRIVRVGFQVSLVLLGYNVAALLGGDILALFVSGLVGVLLFRVDFAIPTVSHVRRLLTYARYSWLSNMKGKTFGWMDTLVLSLFVGPGLIGVYEVSWRLASVLILVSNAVQQTLFPEMSRVATEEDREQLLHLLDEGLFAAGLFVIPGLFGAILLGPKILRIYGPEFVQGQMFLVVLIVARGIDAYGTQFENLINASDRPDLMFRANLLFIISNLVLNLGLVYLFGALGAAVATALSSVLIVGFGFRYVRKLLDRPTIPIADIGRQVLAAVVMIGTILAVRSALPWSNMYVTVGLVLMGAGVFAAAMFLLSGRFRRKALGILPGRVSTELT